VPKRDYYYVSENGRRLYSLALGDLALAFVGASDKVIILHIKDLQQMHGNNWLNVYLSEKHLNLADFLPLQTLKAA